MAQSLSVSPRWHDPISAVAWLPKKKTVDTLRLVTGKNRCNGSARIHIRKTKVPNLWQIEYFIFTRGGGYTHVVRRMVTAEFKTAFDILDGVAPTTDKVYAHRAGVEFGVPGSYVRTGPHLNIPCLKHDQSHAGDPNLSITLNDRLKKRIRDFAAQFACCSGPARSAGPFYIPPKTNSFSFREEAYRPPAP